MVLAWLILLTGLWPLGLAWRASRRTSLFHAMHWGAAAWLSWCAAFGPGLQGQHSGLVYLALCLTGCAGVAVLGARQPGVAAWNFVVLGLLLVLLLPWLESLVRGGTLELEGIRAIFLLFTLAVPVLNYLPTRLAIAAGLAALAVGLEFANLLFPHLAAVEARQPAAVGCLALAPWAGWLALRRRRPAAELDRRWLDFRDRFGLVWSWRLREHFNRSARHAGLATVLGWSGFAGVKGGNETAAAQILTALLHRFGPDRSGEE